MKVEIQSEVVKRVLTDAYTKASTVMNKMDVCDDKMRLADAVAGIMGVITLIERAEDEEELFISNIPLDIRMGKTIERKL